MHAVPNNDFVGASRNSARLVEVQTFYMVCVARTVPFDPIAE